MLRQTGAGLAEAVTLALETFAGGGKLEGPKEGVCLLECRSAGVDFVNQVFNAMDPVFPQMLLNQIVVLQAHALLGAGLADLS